MTADARGHVPISVFMKIYLLLWKDLKILSSNKVSLAFQLITPMLFCVMLLAMRISYKPISILKATDYVPLPVPHHNYTILQNSNLVVAYSPNTTYSNNIMQFVKREMNLSQIVPFDDIISLIYYLDNTSVPTPIAGVAFNNHENAMPDYLKVTLVFPAELINPSPHSTTLNWNTDKLFPLFDNPGPRNLYMPDGGSPGYYREHFVTLQHCIYTAVILHKAGNNMTTGDLPALFLQRFTDPKMYIDGLLPLLKLMLPLIFFLTFLYPCFTNVKIITMEKEMQLKEAMKIMGLSSWLHWVAWLVNIMCFNLLSISSILFLLMYRWTNEVAVFTYSEPMAMATFLLIYTFSVSTYCFLMSCLFDKANTAATVAGFFWFLYLVPFFITQGTYSELSFVQKMIICFFQNTGLSYGFLLILTWEANTEGLHFRNYFEPVSIDDNFSVGLISTMMLFSAFIHMTLAVYVEKIRPGEFGVPRPWYFPVEGIVKLCTGQRRDTGDDNTQNWKYVETVYETTPPGIIIRKLRKVFGGNRIAVHGLSLKMYPNEISVFLGENGAGKTTTMSMLTGMLLPSSGTAIINGCDIGTEIDCVRHSIGFCPQHNILFDELSVRDHIYFYCTLKGMTLKETNHEIHKYVSLLELDKKIDAKSKTLPGGMKRRLSVVVAFCGGSKVVLCDEPTSGMDPSARRAMWDLLQLEKKGRTIMLSTQFMDEADVLGDRVAIMKSGKLICYGSGMYLKGIFASGYLLSIEKGHDCDVGKITAMISGFIPSIRVDRNVGSELTYRLQSEYVNRYENMLKALESGADKLNILSYGISQTSLEDVFMSIVNQDSTDEDLATDKITIIPPGTLRVSQGSARVTSQLRAMMYKRFFVAVRNWQLFLVQNTIPIVLTSITVYIARQVKINTVLPPLPITLDVYKNYPQALLCVNKGITNKQMIGVEDSYRKSFVAEGKHSNLLEVADIPEYIKGLSFPEFVTFKGRSLLGLELSNNTVIAWFNNMAFHSVPVSLDLYYNALLKVYCKKCSVSFVNSPLRFTAESRLSLHNSLKDFGFQLAANVGFAMSFVAAFFVIFYIKERVSRAKLLQIVSGANLWTYWLTSWVFDLVQFLFTTLLITSTLLVLEEEGWNTIADLSRMFVLFCTFIWAILPFIYLCSLIVDVPSNALILTIMFGVFMGNAIFYLEYAFEFPSLNMMEESRILTWAMMSIPHFAVMHGLKSLDKMNSYIPICTEACLRTSRCERPEEMCHSNATFAEHCCVLDYFAWQFPGIGRNMVFQMGVGFGLFILLFLIEFEIPQMIFCRSMGYKTSITRKTAKKDTEVDSDVLAENKRIDGMGINQIKGYNLVLRCMTKYYGSFLAVNNLSLAVGQQECFGLLGINGAGKTTTFKMLIGDNTIDGGEAWVRGHSLSSDMRVVYQNIGYCPQFDALFDELSCKETLKVYCLLRGIPEEWIEYVSLQLAQSLNFVKHMHKKSVELSGGNKRKLSTAIALLGNPAVVYLDEPTTGMDPGAKRKLWQVLTNYRMKGKTIVLTSHSMEECEALCTRLAIMVNGEFQCIGSTQRLKNKFAKSYLLVILMQTDVRYGLSYDSINVQMTVREFVEYQFDGVLKENYQGRLTFHIPMDRGLKWSTMFGIMERERKRLRIENYSLSQATLEEVFLSFTKYQKET